MSNKSKTFWQTALLASVLVVIGSLCMDAQKLASSQQGDLPDMIASVYFKDTEEEGIYYLPKNADDQFVLVKSGVRSVYGGMIIGDTFWINPTNAYQAYSLDTWEMGSSFTHSYYNSPDLCYDPVTGVGYGSLIQFGEYYLGYFDMTAKKCLVRNYSAPAMFGMAAAPDGTVYGIAKNGKLYSIDTTTRNSANEQTLPTTLIGDTGLAATYMSTAAIDPATGDLYYIVTNPDSEDSSKLDCRMYRIDKSTAEIEEVMQFGNVQITAMEMNITRVSNLAPGKVTDLAINFPNGNLSGSFDFKLPTESFNGSELSGSMTWSILVDDDQTLSGSGEAGSEQSASYTFADGGIHSLVIYASNSNGEGSKLKQSFWIGPDVPVAPQVSAQYLDDHFLVSWDAVTEGVNGGYVNPDNVRYTVTRLPANVVVAESTAETSIEDPYQAESLESVQYSVVAKCDGKCSEAGVSAGTWAGALLPPFSVQFNTSEDVDCWTIIDANEDGYTWAFDSYSKTVRIRWNSSADADDWLISPPLRLEGGKTYAYTVTLSTKNCDEAFEVMLGTNNTVEAMTEPVIDATTFQSNNTAKNFEGTLAPATSGTYYVGLHGISEANMYYLLCHGMEVSVGVSHIGPKPVSDLTITPNPTAELNAEVKFIAPNQNVDESELAVVPRIEVLRDGTLIKTFENVEGGSTQSFTDEVETDGTYEYTVIAYNENGNSELVKASAYIGVNEPGKPAWAKVVETSTPGEVTITWGAPEADVDGNYINPEVVKYTIEQYTNNNTYRSTQVASEIEGYSYTFVPELSDDTQGFVKFEVKAVTKVGENWRGTYTTNIPVGEAEEAPFYESFANSTLSHYWGDGETNFYTLVSISETGSYSDYNGWNRLTDESFSTNDGAQDGDNGFLGMFGYAYDDDAYEGGRLEEYHELISTKIDLSGLSNPTLSLYAFNWIYNGWKHDPNKVSVDVVCDGIRTPMGTWVMQDFDAEGWNQILVPLDQWEGKVINFIITGQVIDNFNWVLIDNISIEAVNNTDMAATSISAPVKVAPNEEFEVSATVQNVGHDDVESYEVNLYHGDEVIATKSGSELAPGSSQAFVFSTSLGVNDNVANTYHVEVVCTGDQADANNRSEDAVVAVELSQLPTVEQPQAVRTDGGVYLTWDEPDMVNCAPATETEDFESYDAFSTNAGEWIFVDVDQAPIGWIVTSDGYIELPNIEIGSQQSFWVQSYLNDDFNSSYLAYSGYQYLANMYNYDGTTAYANDDWVISPELYGSEQLITIWAKSYNKSVPETFEVLWSDGSVEPEDFQLINTYPEISVDWTQYCFVVPEGAKRFAIRCTSYACLQLFIDDITYVPAEGDAQDLSLEGYNVYCNGAQLNDEPITDRFFTADYVENAVYGISAVYEEGESKAAKVTCNMSILLQPVVGERVSVSVIDRSIVMKSSSDFQASVYRVDGVQLFDGMVKGSATVNVLPGVYIVKAGQSVTKLIVR